MASSSVAQGAWTPPVLETMEAKREWVNHLHREAALMSAQADFHLRCDLAGYHSNYHALLARLAQGLPLSQEDGARLVEQFKVSPRLCPPLPDAYGGGGEGKSSPPAMEPANSPSPPPPPQGLSLSLSA